MLFGELCGLSALRGEKKGRFDFTAKHAEQRKGF